ncbi:MAG TPA: PBP1A family penicillin-binding protein [Longimicrobiales bacterium]
MGARKYLKQALAGLRAHAAIVAGILAVASLVLFLLYLRCGLHGCPNVDQLSAYQPGGQSVLYDAAGKRFAELAPVQRTFVKLDSLPKYLPDAIVAVEDKRFYTHHGVDYRRVVGALLADIKARGFRQGFSTITMQIAGSVWRDRVKRTQKTIRRKLAEVRIAHKIERRYSKQEILELYLNNVYFGSGAYGVEAAAQAYFRKHARDLTLGQAAMLAALPKSPTIYDPRRSPTRAVRRRNLVLALMAEQAKIDAGEEQRARREKLNVRRDPPPRRDESQSAPYFAEAVRRVLEDHFGEDLYTSPLRIYTTLDRRAQRVAEEELARQLRSVEAGAFGRYHGKRYSRTAEPADETPYLQGAVVLMDARTGAVLAHVGGRDFKQSRFDRVTRAKRQAGSAFKPFVYAAALSEGYAPSQRILDTPLKMELPGGEVWEPRNFTNDFDSVTTLRNALVQSRNVPTIRLAADVGLNDVARVARQSGIRSTIPDKPSMAIGSGAVTPVELAQGYTTFATLGTTVTPRWITRVEDQDGKVLWQPKVVRNQVLDRGVAYLVTDMLREAVNRGTGGAVRRAGFEGPAAGKTGTTNDATDVWFVGYTPDLVGAVWIGFDEPKPIVKDASGGRIAAPTWGRIMRRVYSSRTPAKPWSRPESIAEEKIDPASGLLLAEGCRPRRGAPDEELFLKYAEPATTCPRGKPLHEATVFDRALAWLKGGWHHVGEWIGSHFGREKQPRRPRHEPYLGVPRLPEARDVPTPEITVDTFAPEIDTTLVLPHIDPETIFMDTFADTMSIDTMVVDTLLPDTFPTRN